MDKKEMLAMVREDVESLAEIYFDTGLERDAAIDKMLTTALENIAENFEDVDADEYAEEFEKYAAAYYCEVTGDCEIPSYDFCDDDSYLEAEANVSSLYAKRYGVSDDF